MMDGGFLTAEELERAEREAKERARWRKQGPTAAQGFLIRYALNFVDSATEVGGDDLTVRIEVPRRAWNDLNHAHGEAWDEIVETGTERKDRS